MATSDEVMRDALEAVKTARREATPRPVGTPLSSADETWASSEPDMGASKFPVVALVAAGLVGLLVLLKVRR